MNAISLRINELIEKYFDNNNSKFAEKAGTSEANIRNYRKGTLPRIDFLVNIYENLNVSFEWILLGRGPIIIKENDEVISLREPTENYKIEENENKVMQELIEKVDFIYKVTVKEVARKELENLNEEIEKAKQKKGK